jgi:DUF1680 family protein
MHLFQVTGSPKYASALERTIYNALPAAQSPHTGQVCYFLPENGHRRYGEVNHGLRPDICCCSSSLPRGIALIPEFVSGALDGHPAILQYEAGMHVIPARIGGNSVPVELRISTDYPKSGNIKIEVRPPKAMSFPLVLRVPAWADSFTAKVGETAYKGVADEMLKIERAWSPGDIVNISINLTLQVRIDPDKDSKKIWFMRGPQVLAQDQKVNESDKLPAGWWGEQMYTVTGKRNGEEVRLVLVPFAEAGQNKQTYATMLEDMEPDASALVKRMDK